MPQVKKVIRTLKWGENGIARETTHENAHLDFSNNRAMLSGPRHAFIADGEILEYSTSWSGSGIDLNLTVLVKLEFFKRNVFTKEYWQIKF